MILIIACPFLYSDMEQMRVNINFLNFQKVTYIVNFKILHDTDVQHSTSQCLKVTLHA